MAENQNIKYKSCCDPAKKKTKKSTGLLTGILYGLVPHTFCIAFMAASVLGATLFTGILRKFLLIPYFFEMLIGLSLASATLSAGIYLKRNSLFSLIGVRKKSRYLGLLFGSTLAINLIFFYLVFPALANFKTKNNVPLVLSADSALEEVTLQVDIPCSGHAALISGDLKDQPGVSEVIFKAPNYFVVRFDPQQTSPEQLLQLSIFKTFKAAVVKNQSGS